MVVHGGGRADQTHYLNRKRLGFGVVAGLFFAMALRAAVLRA